MLQESKNSSNFTSFSFFSFVILNFNLLREQQRLVSESFKLVNEFLKDKTQSKYLVMHVIQWLSGVGKAGRKARAMPLNTTHRKAILCDEHRPPGDRYRVRGTAKPRGGHACGSRGHGLQEGAAGRQLPDASPAPCGSVPGPEEPPVPGQEEPPVPGPRTASPAPQSPWVASPQRNRGVGAELPARNFCFGVELWWLGT